MPMRTRELWTKASGLALLLGFGLALLSGCTPEPEPAATGSGPEPADLVLINGGIYTVDAQRSWAEAAALPGRENSSTIQP